jgi:hypothetical protein
MDMTKTDIRWSAVSRSHDWMKDDAAFPASLIQQLTQAGLIGQMEWVETGILKPRQELISTEASLTDYLNFKPGKKDLYSIAGGGEKTFRWKLTLGLFPFDQTNNSVNGYNIISLWTEAIDVGSEKDCDQLFNLFQHLHHDGNTDFAMIHPYVRWHELTDAFYGAYKNPVTFRPFFTGISWAVFLGKEQRKEFDQEKLKKISAPPLLWSQEGSLSVRMTPAIASVLLPEYEKEMIALTDQFVSALK